MLYAVDELIIAETKNMIFNATDHKNKKYDI
jgi:hypothetical protein